MKDRVFICSSNELVSLEVVVPMEYVGDFMVKFGEKFAYDYMNRTIKEVDKYFSRPNGWHVIVSVDKEQKNVLSAFIRNFSKEKNLSFKDADES